MKYLIIGGAGFIGSHAVEHLLDKKSTSLVRVYDNFSSGKMWHLNSIKNDKRLEIINKDLYDQEIFKATEKIDQTWLFAANPDIAKAANEPDIDFHQGTYLTQITLEALRKNKCPQLIYSSGSGVYGDIGKRIANETNTSLEPVSTYGASKVASEALIRSYCNMFGLKSCAFRFGNVVGGRQTHGVAYDFIKRLRLDNNKLLIMGNGSQSKPYIHISDVLSAINIATLKQKNIYDVYNVSPSDYITVAKIADLVIHAMNIKDIKIEYTGGSKGWKGDVPVVRLSTKKIRAFGWANVYNSTEAMIKSIDYLIKNANEIYE